MARRKRINMEMGPRHTKELNWLMDRWGLDMSNTIRLMISKTVREERQKDNEKAPGSQPKASEA